jgi:dolichol kinase
VGTWTKWCLDWRDPWVWAAMFVVEGRRWWTRPALLAYWGLLAVISVAGWSRQLVRARRHRRYDPPVPPSRAERNAQMTGTSGAAQSQAGQGDNAASHPGPGGNTSQFAQMMDAADQRLPTFSVNARRKFFHALAVVMFVPGIAVDVSHFPTSHVLARTTLTFSPHSPTCHSVSHSHFSISRNTCDTLPCGHLAFLSTYSSTSFSIQRIPEPPSYLISTC